MVGPRFTISQHLKNCPHFKSEYGDQCEDIINQTDNEDNAKITKRKKYNNIGKWT